MNKVFRLRKNRDFTRVYRKGRSVPTGLVVLIYRRIHNDMKFGFSVSKKIGNAVNRNRARRRLRECVRLIMPRIKPGYHMIFVARSPIANADYQDIARSVENALKKAGLLLSEEAMLSEKAHPLDDLLL